MPRTADPYDELAAMFLTQPDQPGHGDERTTSSIIELLVVGHLPVRAGLWLTPYADACAREHGPTALLRLDRDEPVLQILRGADTDAVPPAGGTLRDTIRAVAGNITSWIVYAGGTATAADLVRPQPDRITVLSSADDAAVVGAYQHVKNLVNAAESEQTKLPKVTLAVLGADETAASRVFDRVNRTTTAFLGVDVELSSVIQRMDAGVRSTSYVNFPGETSPTAEDIVKLIQQAPTTAPPQTTAQPVAPVESHSADLHGIGEATDATEPTRLSSDERELLHQQSAPAEPVAQPAVEQPEQPNASQQPAVHDGRDADVQRPLVEYVAYAETPQAQQLREQQQFAQTHQRRPARVVPRPHMEVEPKKPDAAREPNDRGKPVQLASHVHDLTPIVPRCPGRERVELAVGRFGRVHLLGKEDTMREMRVVESWVRAHCELLAMACPDVTIDPAARPVCHVFTDTPAELADMHGCDVKLHVLAPVQVNGETAWYAAPLN